MIADLAETYNIYDYRSHPLSRVALFVCNLRENSRVMMKINSISVTTEVLFLAKLIDNTNLLLWAKTKDAEKNRNRPKSILEKLMNTKDKKEKTEVYTSGKEFEERRKEILRNIEKRGKED